MTAFIVIIGVLLGPVVVAAWVSDLSIKLEDKFTK